MPEQRRATEVTYRSHDKEGPRPGDNYSNDNPIKDDGNQEHHHHCNLQKQSGKVSQNNTFMILWSSYCE